MKNIISIKRWLVGPFSIALPFMAVLFFTFPLSFVAAAPLKFEVARGNTGGAIGSLNTVGDDLCPASTTNGCDFSPSDNIVRTNDGVEYILAVQVDSPGDNVYIDTELKPGMVWDQLPGSCNIFTSTITGDGTAGNPSKLYCDLGFKSSWAANLTFVGRALGDNPNGASVGIESVSFYGDSSTAIQADVSGIADVTVTAKPHLNLRQTAYTRNPDTVNGVPGYRMLFQYFIETRKMNTNGNTADDPDPLMGNELVTSNVDFTVDLSQVSPNAYIYDCDNPRTSSTPYPDINSSPDPKRSVIDNGTISCSATGPGTGNITVTVSGADLSLSHYPTEDSDGTAISNDNRIASFGRLWMFIPLTDIKDAGGKLATTTTLTNFSPTSITGQQNFNGAPQDATGGEVDSDNHYSVTIESGNGSMHFTYRCSSYDQALPDWCGTAWSDPPTTASAHYAGDGAIQPGQSIATYTTYNNTSFEPVNDAELCQIIDTRYMEYIPTNGGNPAICYSSDCGTEGVDYLIEYGVGYQSTAWQDTDPIADEALQNECNISNWHSSYSAASTAGEISKIRIRRLTPLNAGKILRMVTQARAKSIAELTSVPNNTLLKAWATVQSEKHFIGWRPCNYSAGSWPTQAHDRDGCGDRVFLTRSNARLDKTTVPEDAVNVIDAGGNVTFKLSPTFTAITGGIVDNLQVVDTLPVGGEYMPGTAIMSGVPFEPVITGDISTGQTLTWDLGQHSVNEVLDPITFKMSTPLNTENGTKLDNFAKMDAQTDASSPEQRGDTRRVSVTAPASMLMAKNVNHPLVEQNGSATFTIDYLNATSVQFNEMDLIDILPYNADARRPATSFSGTTSLVSVSSQTSSGQFYFTKDDPATLRSDPNTTSANDLASGSSNWCPATSGHALNPAASPSNGGPTSNCPQTPGEITGVRLIDTQLLDSGEQRSFTVTLDTNGNFGGDVYTNQAQGTSDGITLAPSSPPASFSIIEEPKIGLAKSTASVANDVITYDLKIENLGNTPFSNLSVIDDLDAVFGAGNYSIENVPAITTAPASGGVTTNASFTGNGAQTELIASDSTLQPNEFAIITLGVRVTEVTDQGNGAGNYFNSATASGTTPGGATASDISDDGTDPDPNGNGDGGDTNENDATVSNVTPRESLTLTKTGSDELLSTPIVAGDKIRYTFVVTNDGNTRLTGVTLQDVKFTPANITSVCTFPETQGTLKPGEIATCVYDYPITQSDLVNQGVTNSAIVTATGITGSVQDVSDSGNPADDTGGADDPTKTALLNEFIAITKTADTSGLSSPVKAGDIIKWKFVVNNTGNVDLTNVTITDNLTDNDGNALTLTSGPSFQSASFGSPNGKLKVNESATYEATFKLSQSEVDAGGVSNSATVNAKSSAGNDVSDVSDDPADITDVDPDGDGNPDDATKTAFGAVESINLTKTANISALSDPVKAGDIITYTIEATNTGNVTLTNLAIIDTLTDNDGNALTLTSGPSFDSATNGSVEGSLLPAEVATYTATYALTQSEIDSGAINNTATVTAAAPSGNTLSNISDDPADAENVDSDEDGDPDDPTSTPFAAAPAINLVKVIDSSALSDPVTKGESVTYTFTVTNTGNVTLNGIALADTITNRNDDVLALTSGPTFVSSVENSPEGTLVPNESATYSATYTLTQADIDSGGVDNTATATGDDPKGTTVSDISDDIADASDVDSDNDGDPDDPTKLAIAPFGRIDLQKTADISTWPAAPGIPGAGDKVTFNFTVTNKGNVTLGDVEITDTLTNKDGDTLTLTSGPSFVSADNGSAEGSLLPNEVATYTASYIMTQDDINSGGLENTAKVDGNTPAGDPVSDISDDPANTDDVDANGDGNPDDPTLVTIPKLEAIDLQKSADISSLSDPVAKGDVVTYNFAVKNTGNITLNSVALSDTLTNRDGTTLTLTTSPTFVSADQGSTEGTVQPNEVATYKATYQLTQDDVDSGGIDNTATVSAKSATGKDVSDISDDPADTENVDPNSDGNPDDPTATLFAPAPELTVLKIDDMSKLSDPITPGDTIDWTISVTNTGNVTLDAVSLTDMLTNRDGAALTLTSDPTFISADQGSEQQKLLVGETATYTASYQLTQDDIDSHGIENSVKVTAKAPKGEAVEDISDDPDGSVGNLDESTSSIFVNEPRIEVVKTDDTTSFSTPVRAGDEVKWKIQVTNVGNVTLSNVALDDTLINKDGTNLSLAAGPTFVSATSNSSEGDLKVGETATYEATYNLTQDDVESGGLENVVAAEGISPNDTVVKDISDDPDDSTNANIDGDDFGDPDDPTKTAIIANPTISLIKTDDLTALSDPVKPDDIVTYTFTATNTGNVHLNTVTLSDRLTDKNGKVLALTSGPIFVSADQNSTDGTLLVGEVATYTATYQITQSDIDAGGIYNTATISGKSRDGSETSDVSDDPEDASDVDSNGNGDPDDPTFSEFKPVPNMAFKKSGDTSAFSSPPVAGDQMQWSFTVTNTGNVTLSGLSIADTLINGDGTALTLTSGPGFVSADQSSSEGDLLVGETATYKATYQLSQADIDSGAVENTATINAKTPAGDDLAVVSDDPNNSTNKDEDGDGNPDDTTLTTIERAGQIALTKAADTSKFSTPVVAGDTIDWVFEVSNTGNVTLDEIVLNDVLTNKGGDMLSLTSGPTFLSSSGGSGEGVLSPGETAKYQASYQLVQADIDAGGISNTAKATASDPADGLVSDLSDDPNDATNADPDGDGNPDDPTETAIEAKPALLLTKAADVSAFSSPVQTGDVITWSFEVLNTGNVTLSSVAIADTLSNEAGDTLALQSGPDFVSADKGSAAGILQPGEKAIYTANYALSLADIDAGGIVNTAVASANAPDGQTTSIKSDDPNNPADMDSDGDGSPDDLTKTPLEAKPTLLVEKQLADTARLFPFVYELTYKVDFENTGNVTLTNFKLEDKLSEALAPGQIKETPRLSIVGAPDGFSVNSSYDGTTQTDLLVDGLALQPGQSGQVEIIVQVDFMDGYPGTAKGNTAYGNSDRFDTPVSSDDPTITPDNSEDTNPTILPLIDTDMDGVPDAQESTTDSNKNGKANYADLDPTGILYCEESGQKLTGGLISVTGPAGTQTGNGSSANIRIIKDGSNGNYQFFVSAAGRYKISYINPEIGEPSQTRLPKPTLDLTGYLPADLAVLGSMADSTGGALEDFSEDANPFHLEIDIEEGDPALFNNNIPFRYCGSPELTAKKEKIGEPIVFADGSTQITYQMEVANTGNVKLFDLSAADDLDKAFGKDTHKVDNLELVSKPNTSSATVNASFDGSSEIELLSGVSDLEPGEKFAVKLVVTVEPKSSGTFTNTLSTDAISPIDNKRIEAVLAKAAVTLEKPGDITGLQVFKTADRKVVRVGDTLVYSLKVTNTDPYQRGPFNLNDKLPTGLLYKPDTSKVNGAASEPRVNANLMTWGNLVLASGESVEITFRARVGGTGGGEKLTNQAYATDPESGDRISNIAKATVRREIEHVFDCGDVIGKVYNDTNQNGYQDQGEEGLPGVRIATVKGLLITTDKHGRYSVPCAALPKEGTGSNFILKLDTRTLPSGYRMTTRNPRVIRLTPGKFSKINFGAAISKVVKVNLSDRAFITGSIEPKPVLDPILDKIVDQLASKKSVLRLNYKANGNKGDARKRLAGIEKRLRKKWKGRGTYKLSIEHRIVGGK